jgi:MFS family permease
VNGPGRAETLRFCAAAFVADWAFYLVFTTIPLKAIGLGGGPLVLGLLPALSSTVYILSALFFGRVSDRGGRMRMARYGALVIAVGALLLRQAPRIPYLFLFLPLIGIGGGLFWPAIQAELGDRGGAEGLGRRVGWFNVSWSAGKMMGFWTAGHIAQRHGTAVPLLLAAAFEIVVFFMAPPDRARSSLPAYVQLPSSARPDPLRKRFRTAAWISNLVAFGVGATLNYQFPKRLFSVGLREGDLGNFLGFVGLMQTLTFLCLGLRRGWEYRSASIVVPMLVGMISVGGLLWASGRGTILLCAPGIGVAMGFAYSASLFHSLRPDAGRGKNTGIHEALLGSGSFLLPLAGGALARVFSLTAPYALCAGACAFSAALAVFWLRSSSTGAAGRRAEGARA